MENWGREKLSDLLKLAQDGNCIQVSQVPGVSALSLEHFSSPFCTAARKQEKTYKA